MEKDAAGCPSLPSHHGLTNPGTSRTSPAAYLTWNYVLAFARSWPTPTGSMTRPTTTTGFCLGSPES